MTVEFTDFKSALSQNRDKLLNVGPEDLDAVMRHYNVTPKDVSDMVRSIRDWLKKQPHLPVDKIQDKQIIGHLIFRGFSVENVKLCLDNYYYAPHRLPDIVCERDPLEPKVAEYIKRGYWCVMPKKTPNNYRISLFRMIPSSNTSISTIIKIAFMLAEYRVLNDTTFGDCWLIDLENVGMQEALQMTPVMISNIVFYTMACFGARLKSVHIINAPSFTTTIINIFKMMVKPKLGDRILLTTKEDLLKFFPKECLPVDYGGEGGSYQEIADEWCKTIQSDRWKQHFVEQNGVFSDESKRLTPSHTDEIFGANGNFRQICTD